MTESSKKQLLILGCSQVKRNTSGLLPAIARYDGSPYRVLRNYLRQQEWPSQLSVAILSARYGLVGGFTGIEDYDQRMTPAKAREWAPSCSKVLSDWENNHDSIFLALGKDYLPAIELEVQSSRKNKTEIFEGSIGVKLKQIKHLLESTNSPPRRKINLTEKPFTRARYFLPDWDDLLDKEFDFKNDSFSKASRKERGGDKHCCELIKPRKICDGILVSLAQRTTTKGPLRRLQGTESASLRPVDMRSQFSLLEDQILFGDCGAFSYINEEAPSLSVEQAISLYDLHGFDLGASVDHIPSQKIKRDGAVIQLSEPERRARVELTIKNAEEFINKAKKRRAQFIPIGTIQALTPEEYAKTARFYHHLGYRHIAVGGLVPLSDSAIEEIVTHVISEISQLKSRPWVHLFGVFRPKLQRRFKALNVDSFDSATYFRKAWLRSSQNYLAPNGKWYAALRVPMTSDGRTRNKLQDSGISLEQLQKEESEVLNLLNKFDVDEATVSEVLEALLTYDAKLLRTSDVGSLREAYKKTLEERPWKLCSCPFCKELGIHITIFRGANRNKRRGAHNTLMLYEILLNSL